MPRSPSARLAPPPATLIPTKLRPPKAIEELLGRPRLEERLEREPEPRVVLVQAPAGYGKTSLLARWHAERERRGLRCAWLTLDEDDNRPARLVLHLAAALVGGAPGAERLEALATDLQLAPTTLTRVVDRLPGLEEGFALFLDEVEHLADEDSLAILRRLIERLPPRARLVLASRTRPEIGLGRLRVSGRLVELGAADLRFDAPETAALLARRNARLAPSDLAALQARTEGWPAALQLSALALDGSADPSAFLRGLTGSNEEIASYLAEEVLARQPRDARRFLLETSILRRLCADACDAVTGRRDGRERLESLSAAGLFLTALDGARTWYRYHPLFSGFLRDRLGRGEPRRVPALHRAAARWHARHGLADDAVHHALAAGDFGLAGRLMDTVAKDRNRQGQFSTVVHWARALPARVLDAHPAIRAAVAWAYLFHRDFEAAERELAAIARRRPGRALPRRVADDVAIVAPIMAGHRDRIADTLELSRRSVALLGAADPFNRGVVRDSLAYGLIAAGSFEEAGAVLLEARADHARSGSLLGSVYTITFEGLLEAVRGRLSAAERRYREAEALASQGADDASSPVGAIVLAYASELFYERDELDEVERRMERHLSLTVETAVVDMVIVAYLTAARLAFTRGDRDEARRRLDEAEQTAHRRSWPRLVTAARFEAVRFALRRGALGEARSLRARISGDLLAAEQRPLRPHAGETEAQEIGDFRLRVRGGGARRALPAIAASRREARRDGRRWRALRLGILEAEALDAAGDHAGALRRLREELREGAPERFVRSFADEGKPITRLVREIRAEARDPVDGAYLDAILRAAGEPVAEPAAAPPPALGSLSRREQEMLDLLGEGLSNRAIGGRLFVSENTVKFHLKAIFAKLGVANRAQAAAVARRAGLV